MNILLIFTGKTSDDWLQNGINEYIQRVQRYINFDCCTIQQIKQTANMPQQIIKENEAAKQLKLVKNDDYVVLLDDKGNHYNSEDFSKFIQKRMLSGCKRLVFVVGGAYGFSNTMYERANLKLSLSAMTFSHQIVRVIFMEQLYRAFTILNNEPYHHGG